jgi:hypothetical protein
MRWSRFAYQGQKGMKLNQQLTRNKEKFGGDFD